MFLIPLAIKALLQLVANTLMVNGVPHRIDIYFFTVHFKF